MLLKTILKVTNFIRQISKIQKRWPRKKSSMGKIIKKNEWLKHAISRTRTTKKRNIAQGIRASAHQVIKLKRR
jgi:hypothetical protein